MDRQDLIAEIRRRLPAPQLLTDPLARDTFGKDWSAFAHPDPLAVALPRSIADLQALVRLARELGLGLVPSGGRTGLSGGAVAPAGELVVSLRQMNRILELHPIERTVRVEAGVVTAAVHELAAAQGLYFPVELAASGSSQIGGNVATNAGGVKVLRYGSMREQVAGLTVVTGRGDVLELNRGLVKNATGYDLRHLFVGSEGTLGILAEVTLKLAPKPGPRRTLLLAVPALPRLLDLLCAFREAVVLNAFEFFCDRSLDAVVEARGVARPFATPAPFYALVDCELPDAEALAAAVGVAERAVAEGWAGDAVVAQDEADCRRLWALREGISEAIVARQPYKNDLSVTLSRLPDFLAELAATVAREYPDFEVSWFGHIGDGNLHLNILRPETLPAEEFRRRCEAVNERIFAIVDRYQGSISAEHGIGLLKRQYLHHSRSAAEIELMRQIKAVFDPDGIMNPGKLFMPVAG